MTQDRLLQRLAAADPARDFEPPSSSDDLFSRIVAGPGDPRMAAGPSSARPRLGDVSSRTRGFMFAGAVAIAGGGVAAVLLQTAPAGNVAGAHSVITVGGAHAAETADIVKRVRSQLTAASGTGFVSTTTWSESGADGEQGTAWTWVDPKSGVEYQRSTVTAAGGAVTTYWSAMHQTAARANGQLVDRGRSIVIDPQSQTYTGSHVKLVYAPDDSLPNLDSSTAQIAQDLTAGTVEQTGTTTVDGVAATVLSVVGVGGLTLDVNTATDQPLRAVVVNPADPDSSPTIIDLQPASSANIANATQPEVPAGYQRAPSS